MVQINFPKKEINLKLVYYGPAICGKTTNLQVLHTMLPQDHHGELYSLNTEDDRTLFFDFCLLISAI